MSACCWFTATPSLPPSPCETAHSAAHCTQCPRQFRMTSSRVQNMLLTSLNLFPASADHVKICAVALNLLHASPTARDASGHTPLHIALQHGSTSAACFIVTRAPSAAMIETPERGHAAIIDAMMHWHCSVQFITACTSANPSLIFKLINGKDLSSWAVLAGRIDIANFIKRNQATLRALTGTDSDPVLATSKKSGRQQAPFNFDTSYSLKTTGTSRITHHTSQITNHKSHHHTSYDTHHISHHTSHIVQ